MSTLQATDAVLLIRPACFGFNAEAALTNALQRRPESAEEGRLAAVARAELDGLAAALDAAGVEVLVVEDAAEPPCPDAVFPNNWISTYDDGTVVLHAMAVASRRAERRPAVVAALAGRFAVSRSLDLASGAEGEAAGAFLEGTGSVVLDRAARVAYACRSPRTTEAGLARYAAAIGYTIHAFDAWDRGARPYHTNVLLSVGPDFAVLAGGLLSPAEERALRDRLARPVILLDEAEYRAMAANLLALRSRGGVPLLALSAGALGALGPATRRALEAHGALVSAAVPTIERVGGGSVRCMIAEIFLPRR